MASNRWLTDQKVDVALSIVNDKLKQLDVGRGNGFAWVTIKELTIYGCYVSPNIGDDAYVEYLENLKESLNTREI